MAERIRRRRISQQDRKRMVRPFEGSDEDYLKITDTLRINGSTAKGIIARYLRDHQINERPRGGRNNVKVNRKCEIAERIS